MSVIIYISLALVYSYERENGPHETRPVSERLGLRIPWYKAVGCNRKTKVVQIYSASILCDGCIYKDFRNIVFKFFRQFLGVPQGGSTSKKVDFQVTPIALLMGV